MSRSFKRAFNKNDELYTPPILVEVLKPLLDSYVKIKKDKAITIWCPFDTNKSEFVISLQEWGYNVVYSHIWNGQDFFEYEPEHWDIVASNPAFSIKLNVFKRLNALGKPWAMAMNMMALNYSEIANYFADNPVGLIIPDKKISFDGNTSSFCTGYVCKGLGNDGQCEFVHVKHNNTGTNFVGSRMMKQ